MATTAVSFIPWTCLSVIAFCQINLSRIVHSRLVHPCHLVPRCPLPRFQRPRYVCLPSFYHFCYAAVLIGRITRFSRSSVRPVRVLNSLTNIGVNVSSDRRNFQLIKVTGR